MKNRTVLLYMTFVFLSNFSTILYFLTVYLEFVGFSMVAISSMMIACQVSKFILEVPTGYIADRFGRKTSGLVGVVGMLGYYVALLLVRSPLLLRLFGGFCGRDSGIGPAQRAKTTIWN